jgi:hypothetical protein
MSDQSRETCVSYIGSAKDYDTIMKDFEAGVNRYGGKILFSDVAGGSTLS